MQNKYFKYLLIVLIVAFVIPQITLAVWWNPFSWGVWNRIFNFQKQNSVVCTKEAKACPDGSAVGRQGPKCEFAECPKLIGGDKDEHGCIGSAGYSWCEAKQKCLRQWEEKCEVDQTANWKTYIYNSFGGAPNFEIKYPEKWIINKDVDGFTILSISNSQPPKDLKLCDKGYLGFKILRGAPYFGTEYISQAGIIEESKINGHKLIKTQLTNLSSDWSSCAESRYFLQTDQNNETYIEIIFYGNDKILNNILSNLKFISIKITSPNMGEAWKIGETHDITWKSENLSANDNVNISIVDMGPTNYLNRYTIARNIPANLEKYSWKISADLKISQKYLIDITAPSIESCNKCYSNQSGYFTISK